MDPSNSSTTAAPEKHHPSRSAVTNRTAILAVLFLAMLAIGGAMVFLAPGLLLDRRIADWMKQAESNDPVEQHTAYQELLNHFDRPHVKDFLSKEPMPDVLVDLAFSDEWKHLRLNFSPEVEAFIRLKKQARRAMAEQFYSEAKDLFAQIRYEEAKTVLHKALKHDANHSPARRLLSNIEMVIGSQGIGDYEGMIQKEFGEAFKKRDNSILETARMEQNALRLIDEKKFEEAVEELEHILETIKWFPYHVELEKRQTSVQALLDRTRRLMDAASDAGGK